MENEIEGGREGEGKARWQAGERERAHLISLGERVEVLVLYYVLQEGSVRGFYGLF